MPAIITTAHLVANGAPTHVIDWFVRTSDNGVSPATKQRVRAFYDQGWAIWLVGKPMMASLRMQVGAQLKKWPPASGKYHATALRTLYHYVSTSPEFNHDPT